jgi:peptidoglycan/LPS O-acetylase OafA/YrhL
LDGLRCLSIAAVIWHHAGGTRHSGLLFRGHHGVSLFFAISGFLITTLLLRERVRNGQVSLGRFYGRRTLRIFPLYYAVIALYVALVYLLDRRSDAGV